MYACVSARLGIFMVCFMDMQCAYVGAFEQERQRQERECCLLVLNLVSSTLPCIHLSRNGNGKHVDIDVQKYLLAAGISQVVSGHQVCVCVCVCVCARACV